MIAEYNGAGALQRKYVYGPGIDEPVRLTSMGGAGTNYFFHADGLGSVTEITGSTGQLVERYRYDVYGAPTFLNAAGSAIAASAIGNRLLFTGRDRDPDTTWYNYRYRYYNPTLGRFVQPDPIDLAGGDVNLYRYVGNGPSLLVDPSGLDGVPIAPPIGPPPIPVPGGGPNNSWVPLPRGERQGWGPKFPIPGRSQPRASWESEGHWDVDDGLGKRQRYDWRGNPITDVHDPSKPPCPRNNPKPFWSLPSPPPLPQPRPEHVIPPLVVTILIVTVMVVLVPVGL